MFDRTNLNRFVLACCLVFAFLVVMTTFSSLEKERVGSELTAKEIDRKIKGLRKRISKYEEKEQYNERYMRRFVEHSSHAGSIALEYKYHREKQAKLAGKKADLRKELEQLLEQRRNLNGTKTEEISTSVLPVQVEESCYQLGYRFGFCATKSLHDIPCNPENDFAMPERCRGKTETNRGIEAGVREVYDTLNLDTGRSDSSSSLDVLTTPLDVLSSRLKGKTKSEVRDLVGSPDRTGVFAGKECWIYGNTYTSKDRGIVFDSGKVITVTFY